MKNGMKKNILIPAISALAVAMLAGGCSVKKNNAPADVPVLVARSVATNVPVRIDPPPVGHVTAFSSVTISPQVGGILQLVHFK
jgi:multidrug efflux pump subunit AcrA (membrane-fusion protein)